MVVLELHTLYTTYIYLQREWGTWPPMQILRYIDVDIPLNLRAYPRGGAMDFEGFSYKDLSFSNMLVSAFMILINK